jgi:glutamate-1-semialdehyde 2,1-aminomutase
LGVPTSPGVPTALAAHTVTLSYNDAAGVREAFRKIGDQIACIIVEPVAGNMNCVPPAPGFLQALREECDRAGAVLIFDEVMTGFRVARGGAQELFGIRPDLTALGKVIGGGLPVGAFGGRAEIMEQLSPDGPVYQAGTLSGNPLAMAAGLAQLRELERIDGWKLLEAAGVKFEEAARSMLSDLKLPWVFHRVGSMFCLFFTPDLVVDLASAKRSDLTKFATFFRGCLERGVYFAPSQFESGFLSTAHNSTDLDTTAAVMREALVL